MKLFQMKISDLLKNRKMRRNFDQNVIYKFTNSDEAPKQKVRHSKFKKHFDLAKLAEQLVAESKLLFSE